MDIGTVGAVGFTLLMGHSFGDHWIQTGRQSMEKSLKGAVGRIRCASHVLTLQTTKLVLLGALMLATGLRLNLLALLAGLAIDGLSHYWADRRFTLEALAGKLARFGKADFYAMGKDTVHQFAPSGCHLGTGAYALDQSFHHLFLFVAALVICI